MSRKMQPLPPDVTLRDLFTHKSRVCRQLSRIFHSGAMVTTKDLCELTNLSFGYVLMATKVFKEYGLIYICDWRKAGGNKIIPVYKAGNFDDTPKPEPKTKRRSPTVREEPQPEPPQDTVDWNSIMHSFVNATKDNDGHSNDRL